MQLKLQFGCYGLCSAEQLIQLVRCLHGPSSSIIYLSVACCTNAVSPTTGTSFVCSSGRFVLSCYWKRPPCLSSLVFIVYQSWFKWILDGCVHSWQHWTAAPHCRRRWLRLLDGGRIAGDHSTNMLLCPGTICLSSFRRSGKC